MKRCFRLAPLLVLLLLAFGGTSYALSVTLVEGALPRLATSPSLTKLAKKAVVLTFADQRVVIHDTRLPVPGELLSEREISLSELFLVADRRVAANGVGYESVYYYRGYDVAIVPSPGQLKGEHHVRLWPITKSMVVAQKPKIKQGTPDPTVQKLLLQLKTTEYAKFLGMLADPKAKANLETRYACTKSADTAVGVISKHFSDLKLATSSDQDFAVDQSKCDGSCKEKTGYNVIAKKTGTKRPDEYYLVGAHYDSVNQDEGDNFAPGCTTAPGAADNASGVAGVMELARVFSNSKLETDATVIFVAFGGEETGLQGSIQYVSKLVEEKEEAKIKAVVILDMISYAKTKDKERLLIEASDNNTTQKVRGEKFFEYAKTYTTLNPLPIHWKYANSDHEPFLNRGMAGGLLIQMQCETKPTDPDRYPFMHSADDTVDRQNVEFATEMLKVAAATLAEAGITFLSGTSP